MLVPVLASAVLVISSVLETAAMLARASPLKPRVCMLSRSSASVILLVAWRLNAVVTSSALMPQPVSLTLIYVLPPFFISTTTASAPASIEFSTSSFTTDNGLSTTSPAAILSATFFRVILSFLIPRLCRDLQACKKAFSFHCGRLSFPISTSAW